MSKIYKIYCDDSNNFYIGSTSYDLKKRLSFHKARAKKGETNKFHVELNKNPKNWKIAELMECDKNILLDTEDIFIKLLKPSLNTKRSNTGIKPDNNYLKNYRAKYKEEIKNRSKEYYLKNKDKIKEYNRLKYHEKKKSID